MPTAAAPMPLAYGRRRRGRRLGGAGLLVTFVAAGLLAHHWRGRWLPPARHRWDLYQLTRSQAKCLAFSPPPGQVVFTDAANDPRVVPWRPPAWCDFLDRARVQDAATDRFKDSLDYSSGTSPAASTPAGPCMLHARELPNGDRVLTCVAVVHNGSTGIYSAYWTVGSTVSPPRLIVGDNLSITKANKSDTLTIYAARLDPLDAARFDVPYQVGDHAGVIHGSVARSGVSLEPDSGWWQPGGGEWVTDGSGVRLHQRSTPDYLLPFPFAAFPYTYGWELAFTADGRRLTGVRSAGESKPGRLFGLEQRIVTWDLATRQVCVNVIPDVGVLRGLWSRQTSPDGRSITDLIVASRPDLGNQTAFVCGIDTTSGREVGRTAQSVLPGDVVPKLTAFAPDGHSIYCSFGDRLFVVDADTWQERASVVLPGRVCKVAVGSTHIVVSTSSPHQSYYDVTYPDRTTVLSARTLKQVRVFQWMPAKFLFAPDKLDLIVRSEGPAWGGAGSPPMGWYLIDPITDRVSHHWTGFSTAYLPYATTIFSPDRQWLAAADSNLYFYEDCAYLWSYPSLDEGWRVGMPTRFTDTLAFSPDGRLLATAADKGIAVWSLPAQSASNPPPHPLPPVTGGR